ncbi:cell division protein FtsZ, partial [Candidatus Dojkabacteria bacterium]|nr:cell division protein FtsZ [Candidatus Dojkabacteria bacterium]
FIAINTDAQALMHSKADIKLRIGEQITRGLGSGGNPIIGRKAAEESVDLVHENLAGADMVFITAGMGGGTGTGASPIVAGIAKNLGALTVGVVTKPFHFEMKRRMDSALKGIEELREKVDTLIVVPNQRLLDTLEKNVPFLDAMKKADDILAQAVKSIANLITQTGLINVDFADVRSVMDNGGTALMGIGAAAGENRAAEASKMAIESPLLEVSIDGAKGVLFNVVGGRDLSMTEISEAAEIVKEKINPDAIFIFGASIDPAYEDKFEVTVLATGFESDYLTSEALNAALTGGLPSVNQPTKQAEQKPLSSGGLLGSLSRPKPQSQAEDDEDLDSLPSFLRRRKREDED